MGVRHAPELHRALVFEGEKMVDGGENGRAGVLLNALMEMWLATILLADKTSIRFLSPISLLFVL